jgi:hypothetical protein
MFAYGGECQTSVQILSINSTGWLTRNLELAPGLFRYWQESVDLPEGYRQCYARHSGGETTIVLGLQDVTGHIRSQWL